MTWKPSSIPWKTTSGSSTGVRVPSSMLGDQVLIRLRDLDKVAYVRFASVYKDFKDLDEFNTELKKLSEKNADPEN